jgi:hypothetical protein
MESSKIRRKGKRKQVKEQRDKVESHRKHRIRTKCEGFQIRLFSKMRMGRKRTQDLKKIQINFPLHLH